MMLSCLKILILSVHLACLDHRKAIAALTQFYLFCCISFSWPKTSTSKIIRLPTIEYFLPHGSTISACIRNQEMIIFFLVPGIYISRICPPMMIEHSYFEVIRGTSWTKRRYSSTCFGFLNIYYLQLKDKMKKLIHIIQNFKEDS